MAHFQYNALTSDEKVMRGTIEAENPEAAKAQLEAMGLVLQELTQEPHHAPRTPLGRNEFLLFNQQLTAIAKAGVPLEQALREMARDVASPKVQKTLRAVAHELEQGKPLPEVIEAHEHLFPPMYAQLMKAGVQTGRLNNLLASLNKHLDMTHQTRRILMEAAAYPMLILFMMLGMVGLMISLVIPTIKRVYEDLGGQLPALTQAVLDLARVLNREWYLIFSALAFAVVLFLVLKSTQGGRKWLESILLKTPILGSLYRASILSRLADALGLLVGSGQPLPDALRLSSGSTGSENLRAECETWAKEIEAGKSIEDATRHCKLVPSYFLYALQVGHQRNELQDTLYLLSNMYTDRVHANQGRLQAVLMPGLLLSTGVVIGLLAVAMMMPYFHMFSRLKF